MSMSTASVRPDGAIPPTFEKPVPMTPPLTAYDPRYLKRKAQVPENVFVLQSGKQFSYFTEGNVEDPEVKTVVCFPAAGFGKWEYVPKEAFSNIFLVAIDDMGHERFSKLEEPPVFEESVQQVVELLDYLNVQKFYVLGHSRGGCHALQIAAALGDRVLGCAVLGSPCDLFHSSVDKKMRGKLDRDGGQALNSQNCCLKMMIRSYMKNMYHHPDKTKDFGFAGHSTGGFKYYHSKATGGAPKEMWSDHFFVTRCLDAEMHGSNGTWQLLFELQGIFRKWSYDCSKITCPTFIYHGPKEEVPLAMAKQTQKIVPGSELVVMEEHGHCSIMMEFENIVAGLVEGKSVQSSYH
jgi:pimeloyl-ACP methyl ester carboxylesterase